MLSIDCMYREAWNRLGDMDQNTSMSLYIELVGKIDPDWETNQLVGGATNTDEVRGRRENVLLNNNVCYSVYRVMVLQMGLDLL